MTESDVWNLRLKFIIIAIAIVVVLVFFAMMKTVKHEPIPDYYCSEDSALSGSLAFCPPDLVPHFPPHYPDPNEEGDDGVSISAKA